MKMSVRSLAIGLGLLALTAGAAQAQPVLNPPTVVGATVGLSWSAVAGATSYNIQAGLAPGQTLGTANVGNVTAVQTNATITGVFYVRVVALPGNEVSNEVVVNVTSLVAPPAAPTNFQVFRNNTGVLISWQPGVGGGPAVGYTLRVGYSPGGSEVGQISTGATSVAVGGGVPAATYYLTLSAVNAGGPSPEATAVLTMPAGGACDVPPTPTLTTTAWGPYLTAAWTPTPGAVAFHFTFSGPAAGGATFGGGQTGFTHAGLPQGLWNFGIQAQFGCGSLSGVGTSVLNADGAASKLEPRAPDPAPGTALQGPSWAAQVVRDVAAAYPHELAASCNNNNFLFLVLRELRKRDKRFGLNWKRANRGDMSTDIITYNWGPDGDEDTPKMRAWDMIAGHCGPNPGPQWDEKTSPTPPAFNGPTSIGGNGQPYSALWTLIPYIQAGFQP